MLMKPHEVIGKETIRGKEEIHKTRKNFEERREEEELKLKLNDSLLILLSVLLMIGKRLGQRKSKRGLRSKSLEILPIHWIDLIEVKRCLQTTQMNDSKGEEQTFVPVLKLKTMEMKD